MSPTLFHESTRVPVTALASCGAFLIAAEGPFLRFYHAKSSQYVASRRVFKTQAVHGISVYAEEHDHVIKLVVWGGRLVRALRLNLSTDDHICEPLFVCLSNVVKAPDWILDLTPRMSSLDDENVYNQGTCAAVTAHNALLEFTIQCHDESTPSSSTLVLSVSELTTSSRSILYSAHLLWEYPNCILVAAGTAFGEIMYWSWNKQIHGEPISQIHQVFLGHEGSIFDVRISKELQRDCCGTLKRAIASCSDDRTIRLWDVSDVDVNTTSVHIANEGTEAQRTRHTGFSVAATDVQSNGSNCLAIGWGHTSRVWKVRFLPCDGTLALLSAGEDATSRTWKLVAHTDNEKTLPCALLQTDCAAYHNGKNMWSTTTYLQAPGLLRVACGAADSKLTTHPLLGIDRCKGGLGTFVAEYTVQELLQMAQPSSIAGGAQRSTKASKKTDSIRSYCFLDNRSFLLVTNSGKLLLQSFIADLGSGPQGGLSTSTLVNQLEDLSGYSTCASAPTHGIAFVAGTKGSIYMYSRGDSTLESIHMVTGKVGGLFVRVITSTEGQTKIVLLVTVVGQKQAHLLLIDPAVISSSKRLKVNTVPISETLTGSSITSMERVERDFDSSTLLLGFRRGAVGLYNVSGDTATLFRVIEKVHGDETVTAIRWLDSTESTSIGRLYSVGRDGCLAVHLIDFVKNTVQLVHSLLLPIGPNIEDLYFHEDRLLVHGFSSKKWVLYDVASEEEIMGVETGGAHRSWAFQPSLSPQGGGTLVWTRTSSLHVCSQEGSNHGVLRSGGHGREIKAVAMSPLSENLQGCLTATGAEDTDIKIFQYIDGEHVCRRTLRKHTTGIQHLQWSDDGNYLFSSAGSEEFYIWRIRALSTTRDIGVVCEYVYTPESEFSDLRIMSFDVTRRGSAYTIAMVFSDSSVKTYRYDATVATKWQPLAKGIYFTSCLTQCVFLSPQILLTAGTDGHAVLWPLSDEIPGSSTSLLKWQHPARIHQNGSKTMSSYANGDDTILIVSGGDDGALAFLLAYSTVPESHSSPQEVYASPPVLVSRAHCSAVTACTIVAIQSRLYVLTSGNDEWVRLWEVVINNSSNASPDKMSISRLSKVKTSVADVSSMALLDNDNENTAKVLVCGVGMDIVRLEIEVREDSAKV